MEKCPGISWDLLPLQIFRVKLTGAHGLSPVGNGPADGTTQLETVPDMVALLTSPPGGTRQKWPGLAKLSSGMMLSGVAERGASCS